MKLLLCSFTIATRSPTTWQTAVQMAKIPHFLQFGSGCEEGPGA
jgi:hypothetical protein